MIRPTRESTYTDTLVPDPTLSRSSWFNDKRSDARPGAEPGNPPADTEQGRPADKAGGEIGFGRQMKLSSGDRFGHAGYDAPRDRHDNEDRTSTRLNSSHSCATRLPSSARNT